MEIHYIYDRIEHHSAHAGYDQLVKCVSSNKVKNNFIYSFMNVFPEKILARMRKTAGNWYCSEALKLELQTGYYFIKKHNSIFHFLYGEDSFHYSGYLNFRKSNKIVVTYHHPPEKFDRIITNKRHLRKIDAIIVVCSQQVDYFRNWVMEEKIHLVHHGIDTEYFYPAEIAMEKERKQCLFVGTHLRDYETLKNVISKVNCMNKNINFTIVTDGEIFNKFSELRNVKLLTKIDEIKLMKLYRESDVLLLPLTGCTANNTLLEAMACGLPIITNDVGGVKDYLDKQCAYFIKQGNAEHMATQLIELVNNDIHRREMSLAARKKALQFDWKIVANKMKNVYKGLF